MQIPKTPRQTHRTRSSEGGAPGVLPRRHTHVIILTGGWGVTTEKHCTVVSRIIVLKSFYIKPLSVKEFKFLSLQWY